MITRNTANRAMNTAINGVVPHPGDTFPYSELRGFSKLPRLVTSPLSMSFFFVLTGTLEVAIIKSY